jgi:hypothetical protein
LILSPEQLSQVLPESASEAILYFKEGKLVTEHTKDSKPNNKRLMLILMLQVLLFIGISSHNIIQIKLAFGSNPNKPYFN